MKNARTWGIAWVLLTIAFGLHVWDEAANDFLSVYNPTVRTLREKWPFLPLPTFTFGIWLGGLCAAVLILALFSPAAFRGRRWLRFLAYPYSVIMLLNGVQHIAVSMYFGRPMPGVLSAPLLVVTSIALFVTTGMVTTEPRALSYSKRG